MSFAPESGNPPQGRSQEGWNPIPAAALLSAVITLAVAAVLPVHFSPRPNLLGIVSVATVSGYPMQQEMFWLAYGVGALHLPHVPGVLVVIHDLISVFPHIGVLL